MALISLEEIVFRYGRHKVLRGVDMRVNKGECVVLFGANGSGKSTLLSILNTHYRLREGRYLFQGEPVENDLQRVREQLLFVGHQTGFYGHLSPRENYRFFQSVHGLTLEDHIIEESVKTLGLYRFIDRPVGRFSAGMRKKLALGRILLFSPKLLLLDEPYSALDYRAVDWLNEMITRFLKQGGTVIMVSHTPEKIATLPHTAYTLKKGRITPDHDLKEATGC
ncbi:heme ABC exporter ATP-binding protein CcmA [Magnetococcales bacterium HHB-1]